MLKHILPHHLLLNVYLEGLERWFGIYICSILAENTSSVPSTLDTELTTVYISSFREPHASVLASINTAIRRSNPHSVIHIYI